MARADGTVYVDTKINTEGVEKGAERMNRAFKSAAKTVSEIGASAQNSAKVAGSAFSQPAGKIGELEAKVESLKQKLADMSGQKVATPEYSETTKEIEKLEKSLSNVIEKEIKFTETGGNVKSQAMERMEYDIDMITSKLEEAREKKSQLESSGNAFMPMDTSVVEQQLAAATQKLTEMKQKEAEAAAQSARLKEIGANAQVSNQGIVNLSNELSRLKARQSELSAAGIGAGYAEYDQNAAKIAQMSEKLKEYNATLKKSQSGTLRFADKIKNAFSGITSAIGKAKSGMETMQSSTGSMEKSFSKGLKSVLKYGFGIRSLYVLVKRLKSTMEESLKNLADYDDRTNASLQSLSSALDRVKGSLATAFSPILNAIAPAVTKLINILADGITAIGMFFSALTGQSTYMKAVTDSVGTISSIGDAAGSSARKIGTIATATKDAAKETKKANEENDDYLSGLDEVKRWESKEEKEPSKGDTGSGSGGGGGGSSGGGGGGGGSLAFVEESLPKAYGDFASMVKDAWAKADFTEIGRIVGDKLKSALEKIPWTEIQDTVARGAKSVATFLNGFFETPGLFDTIGKTIGNAINTGLIGIETFLDFTHFDSIGKALTTSLYSAIDTIDWSRVSGVFSKGLSGALDLLSGIVDGINWRDLPSMLADQIKEAISGFDFKSVFHSVGKLIGTALIASIDLLSGIGDLVGSFIDSLMDYFGKYISDAMSGLGEEPTVLEIGAAIIQGILNGAIDVIKSIGTWLYQNVVEPILSGLASAFQIGSPSKLPAILEVGKNIMLGILNGIIEAVKDIGGWIKDHILQPILDGFSDVGSFFKDTGKAIWDGISGAIDGAKKAITLTFTAVVDKGFELAQKAYDAVKDSEALKIVKGAIKGTFDKVKTAFEEVKDSEAVKTFKAFVEDKFNDAKEAFLNLKPDTITKTIKAIVEDKFNDAKDAFEKIQDSEAVKTFKASVESKFTEAKDAFVKIVDGTAIKSINGKTLPAFTTVQTAFNVLADNTITKTITGSIANKFTSVKDKFNAFKGNTITKTITGSIANKFNSVKAIYNKVTNSRVVKTIAGATANSFGTIKKKWNSIKSKTVTLKAKIQTFFSGLSSKVRKLLGLSTGGIYRNGKWHPIQGYASGGNPRSARLFYANENGMPELIGRIGGNTSVMNNDQIVASVSAGVYKAVLAALGRISGYFSSMSLSMSKLPDALQHMQISGGVNAPAPKMANGSIIPPRAGIDAKEGRELRQTIDGLNTAIEKLNGLSGNRPERMPVGTIRIPVIINGKQVFEAVIDEAKMRQMALGRNPFEMV